MHDNDRLPDRFALKQLIIVTTVLGTLLGLYARWIVAPRRADNPFVGSRSSRGSTLLKL